MDVTKLAKLLGKLGGQATKKKLGKAHFRRISVLGVAARKAKKEAG